MIAREEICSKIVRASFFPPGLFYSYDCFSLLQIVRFLRILAKPPALILCWGHVAVSDVILLVGFDKSRVKRYNKLRYGKFLIFKL